MLTLLSLAAIAILSGSVAALLAELVPALVERRRRVRALAGGAASGGRRSGREGRLLRRRRDRIGASRRRADARLVRDLAMLGFDGAGAVRRVVALRWVLAVVLPLPVLLGPAMQTRFAPMLALALIAAGFILPERWIGGQAERRRQTLRREFPQVLELLQLYLGTGLGLARAMEEVAETGRRAFPALSRLFGEAAREIHAGRPKADALRNLAEQAQVSEIRAFLTVATQADTFGTGLADAVSRFSEGQRRTLYLDAERRAGRIPALMTVPLLVCIMPAVLTAVLLPGVIGVLRDLSILSGGGG